MYKDWKRYLLGIAALALGLISAPAMAGPPYPPPCDFFTGGGFVVRDSGAKGTFGVGGGCKHGQPWGHLEYHDHGTGLNVHWLTITGYTIVETRSGENDPKRKGTRLVCGTARTNHFGEVNFLVGVVDEGEPGVDDRFEIRLTKPGVVVPVYTTETDSNDSLGGSGPGGGNIQLHKPNPSTAAPTSGCAG